MGPSSSDPWGGAVLEGTKASATVHSGTDPGGPHGAQPHLTGQPCTAVASKGVAGEIGGSTCHPLTSGYRVGAARSPVLAHPASRTGAGSKMREQENRGHFLLASSPCLPSQQQPKRWERIALAPALGREQSIYPAIAVCRAQNGSVKKTWALETERAKLVLCSATGRLCGLR